MLQHTRAIKVLNEELETEKHPDVIAHYNRLLEILKDPPKSDVKILVFHPICAGDVFCSQFCAELFQLKYPNCSVTYMTETPEALGVLRTNPFIDHVIFTRDWDDYLRIKDQYTEAYALYWWNAPMLKSFLEDLNLPTNYLRARLYKNDDLNKVAKPFWSGTTKPKVLLQTDLHLKWNSEKYGSQLLNMLNERDCHFRPVGLNQPCCETYDHTIELMRESDIVICMHGSLAHAANLVGAQTIELSTVYNPEWVSPAYYQNNYKTHKSLVVRPSTWCGEYRCVISDHRALPIRIRPYFPQNRFTPQLRNCAHGFSRNCCYEISPELIIAKLDEALAARKNHAQGENIC